MIATRTLFAAAVLALPLSGCVTPGGSAFKADWDRAQSSARAEDEHAVGLRFTTGNGVTQDYAAGVNWFRKAAAKGYAPSQYMAGVAYYTGRGVPWNYPEAIRLFEMAAAQGHDRSQFQLADAYANGRGVDAEPEWGMRWAGKAARQGHKGAQYMVGIAYGSGLGLPVSRVASYKWLSLAEKAGHSDAAKARSAVAEQLNAAQRQRATTSAAAFKPVTEKAETFTDVPSVVFAQLGLKRLKAFTGVVDGVTGPATKKAISAYRKRVGLKEGGLDRALITKLRQDVKATRPAKP